MVQWCTQVNQKITKHFGFNLDETSFIRCCERDGKKHNVLLNFSVFIVLSLQSKYFLTVLIMSHVTKQI